MTAGVIRPDIQAGGTAATGSLTFVLFQREVKFEDFIQVLCINAAAWPDAVKLKANFFGTTEYFHIVLIRVGCKSSGDAAHQSVIGSNIHYSGAGGLFER
jgi:hypothetical protein